MLRAPVVNNICLKISGILKINKRNVFSLDLYQPCLAQKVWRKSKIWSKLSGRFLRGHPLNWISHWRISFMDSILKISLLKVPINCFHMNDTIIVCLEKKKKRKLCHLRWWSYLLFICRVFGSWRLVEWLEWMESLFKGHQWHTDKE